MSPGSRKNMHDRLQQLKAARTLSDYFVSKQPADEALEFRKLNAASWEEYAHKAISLASGLLPDLEKIVNYP